MIYTAVSGRAIPLGFLGENRVEAVVFDRTCWLSEYGPGTFELIHRRSQDTDPFPIAVTVSGGTVTWIPTESDTAYRGVGECQLSFYTPDGKLKKSEIYQTITARSLTSAEDPPSPAQGWVAEVLAAAAGIQNMQVGAETNLPGTPATVVKTVDPETGVVTLTFGIPEGLKGDTGRGIASMSVLSTGEWRVVYTDGTSETVGYDVYSALDALKAAAQEAAETASDKATEAASSARNAEQDADRAEQGAKDAQTSATAAQQAKTDAETAKTDAETAARNAEHDADRAEQGADRAEQGAEDAQQAKTDAESAKTDAETAARNAEEWASQVDPDNLAHIDGYYPDMTVGNAEQLVSTLFVEDTEPYNFRKAGGSHDIGNREYDEIVGGSLPWNQLVNTSDTTCTVQSGHVYLARISGTDSVARSSGTAISVNGATDNVFDLTLIFGSAIADYIYSLEQANAGAGVAWVRRYLPNDYYSYNPGSMESVQVSAHKMVGFNQLPASPEYISNTTVLDKTKAVRVFGGVPYEYSFVGIGSATSWRRFVKFWEMDGTMQIGGERPFSVSSGNPFWSSNNGWIDSMNNAARRTTYTFARDGWVLFQFGSGDTTPSMTVDSACFHFVHSGYRNGEYEPYVEHVYPLDDSLTLRGIPTLDGDKLKFDGDIYSADGTVQRRYGIVDLGTFNWTRSPDSPADGNIWVTLVTGKALKRWAMRCAKYVVTTATIPAALANLEMIGRVNNSYVYIRDDTYTTAAAFKAAMAGVMLVYELATPTTETAEPFQSPQIVDGFGTEEYIDAGSAAGTRDFAFPVGHDTKYPPNLRDKLQKLPSAAAENGRYVIQQTDGNMTLVPDTSPGQIAALAARVPDPPTADGTYILTVTLTDGTPAYSWVQA